MKIWTLVLVIKTAQGGVRRTFCTDHERTVNMLRDENIQRSYDFRVAKCDVKNTQPYNVILTEIAVVQKDHVTPLPVGHAPYGTHICHDGVEHALNALGCCDRCGENIDGPVLLDEPPEPGVSYINPDIDQED